MECPICKLKSISPDHINCPQCESDLTSFRILEALPDSISETKPEIKTESELQQTPKAVVPINLPKNDPAVLNKLLVDHFAVLFMTVCLILGLATIFIVQEYRLGQIENLINDQKIDLNKISYEFKEDLKKLSENVLHNRKIININKKKENTAKILPVNEVKSTIRQKKDPIYSPIDEIAFFVYSTKKNETLWRVAKKFYGTGYYYPVILVHNPDISICQLKENTNILILKNKKLAEEIFSRVTEKNNDRLYYKYKVKIGDTFASIINRYCPKTNCKEIIFKNTDGLPSPGKHIKILME